MAQYKGGKNGSGVFQTIINQIPPHDLYIEMFAGSGAVLRKKRPAAGSIAIDADASCVDKLRGCIPDLTVIHGDAISLLRSCIAESGVVGHKIFIYADPPYLFSVRSSKHPLYTHEFGDDGQHRQLLRCLRSLDCMVMLSGYWSELYAEELMDWRTVSYNSTNRAGDVVHEWLWMNYPEPVALHDYTYLGLNFREREKIKRKTNRWLSRLGRMSILERRALLLAMDAVDSWDPASP